MIFRDRRIITPKHVADVRERGLRYLDSLGSCYTFHNAHRAKELTLPTIDLLVDTQKELDGFRLDLPGRVVLEAAGAFIDTGIARNYWPVQRAQTSNTFLEQELRSSSLPYTTRISSLAQTLISSASIRKRPTGRIQKLFHDANFACYGSEDFLLWNTLLRQEASVLKDSCLHDTAKNDKAWNAYSLRRIASFDWYSQAGYELFEGQRRKNVQELKQRI